MRPKGLHKPRAEGLSSGRFPRTPPVAYILGEPPSICVRDRGAHSFSRKQYMATNVISVIWACSTFGGKLQASVRRKGTVGGLDHLPDSI